MYQHRLPFVLHVRNEHLAVRVYSAYYAQRKNFKKDITTEEAPYFK